jgi:phosphoglycerate dehydrogenase-like enzyme
MGSSPSETILVLSPVPEPTEELELLRAKFPEATVKFIRLGRKGSPEENPIDKAIFKDVTILFSGYALPDSKEDAPNLKYVHLLSAGVEHIVSHPFFIGTDIPFTNCSGVHAPQISEWVIMTALIHFHKYKPMYEAQKEHKWLKGQNTMGIKDLPGQRLGVLGYGAIGRQSTIICFF